MPTPRAENLTLLLPSLLLATVAWLFSPSVTQAVDYGNEVSVWVEQGRVVATSLVSGRREIPLDAQETVIDSGTSGINAVVVTSRRLLGFSSRTFTWAKKDRDLNEKVIDRRVLPTYSVVRTDKHLYGFRGANGIWLDESLGVRESVKMTRTTDMVRCSSRTNGLWALRLCSATSLHRHSASTSTSRGWTTKMDSSSSPPAHAYSCSAAA